MTIQEFRQHEKKIEEATTCRSDLRVLPEESKQAILDAKDQTIKWMLEDLAIYSHSESSAYRSAWAWITILREAVEDPPVITGENRGKLNAAAEAWVNWGVDYEYLPGWVRTPSRSRDRWHDVLILLIIVIAILALLLIWR